ncbi:MAG TPA: hypothetical protein PLC96_07785 [Bacteroidales bacterium]|nr:hypothetical protein [Bacteroidales bacterium]
MIGRRGDEVTGRMGERVMGRLGEGVKWRMVRIGVMLKYSIVNEKIIIFCEVSNFFKLFVNFLIKNIWRR